MSTHKQLADRTGHLPLRLPQEAFKLAGCPSSFLDTVSLSNRRMDRRLSLLSQEVSQSNIRQQSATVQFNITTI
jgi:hypothetical protein